MSTKKMKQALELLSRTKAHYGYQGPSGDEPHPTNPELTIKDLAKIQEYGLGVPARPLIRVTADRHRAEFTEAAKRAAQAVARGVVRDKRGRFAGRDIETAVRPVAQRGLEALRDTLERSKEWARPNARMTIERKGHDHPLIGTEKTLRTHASWAIIRDGLIIDQGGEE